MQKKKLHLFYLSPCLPSAPVPNSMSARDICKLSVGWAADQIQIHDTRYHNGGGISNLIAAVGSYRRTNHKFDCGRRPRLRCQGHGSTGPQFQCKDNGSSLFRDHFHK